MFSKDVLMIREETVYASSKYGAPTELVFEKTCHGPLSAGHH